MMNPAKHSKRTGKYPVDNEKGFNLIELLVALTIFAIGILAVAAMQTAALRGGAQSSGLTMAVRDIMQDKVEALLSLDYDDTNLTSSEAGTSHPTSGTPESVTANGVTYSTTWTVTDYPLTADDPDDEDYAKQVTVTTTWTDLSGSHTVNATVIKDSVL